MSEASMDKYGISMQEILLAKFPEFDPSWSQEQQSQWFAAFQRLIYAAIEPVERRLNEEATCRAMEAGIEKLEQEDRSRRDLFAARALTGLTSPRGSHGSIGYDHQSVARYAWDVADAMLEAEKTGAGVSTSE